MKTPTNNFYPYSPIFAAFASLGIFRDLVAALPRCALCGEFFLFSLRLATAATSYLNSGMTFSANRRIFFNASSCGMPPK